MTTTNDHAAPPPLIAKIEAAMRTTVRPELRELGGDVELVGIDDAAIVQVRLLGACAACASSTFTWILMIESALRREVPEIRSVEAIP